MGIMINCVCARGGNMTATLLLIRQVIVMFLLSAIGWLMFKGGKITLEGNRSIGNILIYLSLPCVIIRGFEVERTAESLSALGLSALLAAATLGISLLVSRLSFKENAVASFAATFPNPGFFGVPLIVEVLGRESVFYIAAFIAMVNLLQWTYGVSLFSKDGRNKVTAKRIFTAPFMIAILIGLFLFFTQIELPSILSSCVDSIAALNTPLAMFTIGVYAAQTDMAAMFRRKKLYQVALIRQIIIPLLASVILAFVNKDLMNLRMAILIAIACPVGSNVAVYAQLHGQDYAYAVETVVISTLTSIITLPIILSVMQMIG